MMKLNLSNRSLGITYYLLSEIVVIALMSIFKKYIKEYNMVVYEAVFYRQIIVVICLIPILLFTKTTFLPTKETINTTIQRHGIFAITTLMLYTGLKTTPINDASVILFIIPIIGSVLSVVVLKEHPSKKLWIGLFFAFIGSLIVKRPQFNNMDEQSIGYLLLFLVAIFRGYIVPMNKKITSSNKPFTILFNSNFIMLIVSLFTISTFKWHFPLEGAHLILLSAFGFLLEYFLIFKAYKLCKASTLQPLDFGKLVFSMIISYLILGEKVTTTQILGGFVVFAAFMFTIFGPEDKKKKLKN